MFISVNVEPETHEAAIAALDAGELTRQVEWDCRTEAICGSAMFDELFCCSGVANEFRDHSAEI